MSKTRKTTLIAIDIGNTSMHVGIFANSRLVKKLRVGSCEKKEILYNTFKRALKPYMEHHIKTMISSVAPCATKKVSYVFKTKFKQNPIVIGKHVKVPIKNLYKKPSQVGQDRLVNAYACRQLYGSPAIVVDFGTATTFDYVNENGDYEGGIITPGVETTINSLADNTALLPRIKLRKPKNLIGKDTIDSIRSGVVYGLACMCDGLIAKIIKDRKLLPLVIVTGGFSELFCGYLQYISILDKDLTLKGLDGIYCNYIKSGF
jgi:type III pantothenate kinase